MINLSINKTITLIQVIITSLLLFSTVYADTPKPQQLMEETSRKMIVQFQANSTKIHNDPQIALSLINDNLVPKINFPLMSRWVLGKNWKKASKPQQQLFIHRFQKLVVKFYSKALLEYLTTNSINDDIITFIPFRGKLKGKYATVRSHVNPPNGAKPINVNYELYHSKKTGLWQVYDVSVEGISLVTSYRSSFKQIISQKGMDALLLELKNKTSAVNYP
jgi:phospholipid transport system substrate-binding protein